jgi:hypothetical protein
MNQNQANHFLGSKECEFKINGRPLTEFRRARLRLIAKALSLPADGPKNLLLQRILAKLRANGADTELREPSRLTSPDAI